MKTVLNIVTTIVLVLGYLLSYVNKEKLGKSKTLIVLICCLLGVLAIWGKDYLESRESKAVKGTLIELTEKNDSLLKVNNSVQVLMEGLKESNKELTKSLEPFIRIASTSYPQLTNKEALDKLATEISKMRPKLVFIENRIGQYRDTLVNSLHTVYIFRSQPSVELRDVYIKIRFKEPFISASARKRGAIVLEQGSKLKIDSDSSGFVYNTDFLSNGNDIIIDVESKQPPKIITIDLLP